MGACNAGAIPLVCESNLFCLGQRNAVFSPAKTERTDEYIF
jgi:hypothetical protein